MISRFGGDYREFVAEFYDLSYERRGSSSIEFFLSYSKKAGGRTLELGRDWTCPDTNRCLRLSNNWIRPFS